MQVCMALISFLPGIPTREAETQLVPDKCDPRVFVDAAVAIGGDIISFIKR